MKTPVQRFAQPIVLLSIIAGVLFTIILSQSVGSTADPTDSQQASQDMKQLQKLVRDKHLDQLVAFERTISDHWKTHQETGMFLLSELCKSLNSEDFGDPRSALYARQCAKAVLGSGDTASVDVDLDMLKILQEIEEYRLGVVKNDMWPKDRDERVNYLVYFAKRLKRDYDPQFDFKSIESIPRGNVCPHAANYLCGISPDSIKEPDVRANYISEIEKNRQKASQFNMQLEIHRIMSRFDNFVDRFLIGMYSQPPYDSAGLVRSMDRLDILGDRRTVITSAVSKNLDPGDQ